MTDTRPKPSKQQMRLYIGLSDKLMALQDEESSYFDKERPWMLDRTYPKPWKPLEKPEWEKEKQLLKKKMLKIHEELDKLFKEMYPPSLYPEMHKVQEQPSLIEGVPSQLYNVPEDAPRTVENMTQKELEEVFGGRSIKEEVIATTPAGAEILKQFQAKFNRRKGY